MIQTRCMSLRLYTLRAARIGGNLSKASRKHGQRGHVSPDSSECNHNVFRNPVRRGFDVPRNERGCQTVCARLRF